MTTTDETPVEVKKRYKNKARCKLCGDIIESKFRHDFVSCSCNSLSLDGGLAYRRVLWKGGEYADVVDDILEEITPVDVQVTANISARERDNEQEYYKFLLELLRRSYENEDDGKRTQDGTYKWEVPVRASSEHGKKTRKKAKTGGTSPPP